MAAAAAAMAATAVARRLVAAAQLLTVAVAAAAMCTALSWLLKNYAASEAPAMCGQWLCILTAFAMGHSARTPLLLWRQGRGGML